jgi:Domain of unknown function (DUF4159)
MKVPLAVTPARDGRYLARRFFALVLIALLPAFTAAADEPRGGRVGWARLITSYPSWKQHSDQDPKLAGFIRSQTNLNIDPVWYTVDPGDLDQLCAYPFIYVKDLTSVRSQRDLDNIQEFFRRGGFICIDPCISGFSAGDLDAFLKKHTKLFTSLFSDCTVRELPDSHEIFRCYFNVTVDDLFPPDMIRLGASKPEHIGMVGVFLGERMIAAISVSGLECGWPQTPLREPGCMKMIVNSYIYAMTR